MNEVKIRVENFGGFCKSAIDRAQLPDEGNYSAETASLSFASMEQFLKILTPNRWPLLPARDYRSVHADVAALSAGALIGKLGDGKIRVPWTKNTAEMDFGLAA